MKWLLKLLLPALVIIWCFCAGAKTSALSVPGVNQQTPSSWLVAKKKKKKKKKVKKRKRNAGRRRERAGDLGNRVEKRKTKAPATTVSPLELDEKPVEKSPAEEATSPDAWDAEKQPQTQDDPWPDSFGDPATEESGTQDTSDDVSFDSESVDTADQTSAAYPTSKIARPLVLPPMLLEAHGGLQFDFIGEINGTNVDNILLLHLGGAIGVVDKLEAGLSLPILFVPKFDLGEVRFFGKYDLKDQVTSLLGDKFDLAVRTTLAVPISDAYIQWLGADFVFLIDAPIRYHLLSSLALVGDLSLGFAIGEEVGVPLFFDVGALYQAMENLSVEGLLGLHFWFGSDSYTMIPLKIRGTYTLLENLDLVLDVGFFDFNDFGVKYFQMMAGAAYRLQL